MIMIGDNEYTDIVGAYNAGWDSILVRSGVTFHESKIATVNAMSIFEGL
jgi:ribonucleotide monophosphatase NagD (HAD superfamily)